MSRVNSRKKLKSSPTMVLNPFNPISRRNQLAELFAQKPPTGREPILPRVYEYYEDEGADLDDDYFDSKGNLRNRRHTAVFGEGSLEDILSTLYSKKSRKQRVQEAKLKYENFKKKEEKDRIREAELQRLEDQKSPSMMGFFYTDGYYDSYPPFGINPDLLAEYSEKEAIFFENLRKQRGSPSFTEQFRKHFWPPKKLCCKACTSFRTRGSYLDFPEVNVSTNPPIKTNCEHPGVEMTSNQEALKFAASEDLKPPPPPPRPISQVTAPPGAPVNIKFVEACNLNGPKKPPRPPQRVTKPKKVKGCKEQEKSPRKTYHPPSPFTTRVKAGKSPRATPNHPPPPPQHVVKKSTGVEKSPGEVLLRQPVVIESSGGGTDLSPQQESSVQPKLVAASAEAIKTPRESTAVAPKLVSSEGAETSPRKSFSPKEM